MDCDETMQDCKTFMLEKGCPADICGDITVKVPVVVCAESEVGKVEFKCKGTTIEQLPELLGNSKKCERFKVIQKIQVRIPLTFEAEVEVCKGHVEIDVNECK
jgi:hypothetical protein